MSKNKLLLYILGVLAVILLGILIFGVYIIRIENQNISQITNQADEAANESTLAGSVRSIKNIYQKQIDKILVLLVHSDDLVPLIDSVERLGKDMGLDTKTVSVVQDKISTKGIKYPLIVHINTETEGSWGNSMRYLQALENLPTNITIENASLSLNNSTNDSDKNTKTLNRVWRLNVTFAINIFK